MKRLFFVTSLTIKYAFLLLHKKLGVYKVPNDEIIKNFFEEAGGIFVKFGQVLAMRVDMISDTTSLKLLDLLDNVKPFPYKEVERIFQEEFNKPPNELFSEFEEQPFAAASFGQVHAAKLENGKIVAVKIQRPGMQKDILTDIFFLKIAARVLDMVYKFEALTWKQFVKEFEQWTKKELDYNNELKNTVIAREKLDPSSILVIPQVYKNLSSEKILTQEYIEGFHLSKVMRKFKSGQVTYEQLEKVGIDLKKITRQFAQELIKQYFVYGFFHADPHPGNIILLNNGKVALIDYGIAAKSYGANQKSFVQFIKSSANFDFKNVAYYSIDFAGSELKQIIASAMPQDAKDEMIDEVIKLLADEYSALVEKEVLSSIEDLREMRKDYTRLFLQNMKHAEKYHIRLPTHLAVFFRTIAIFGMLAKQLDKSFLLAEELKTFFKNHSEDTFVKEMPKENYKTMSREKALDKLNRWLSRLIETEPKTYHIINAYMKRYQITT